MDENTIPTMAVQQAATTLAVQPRALTMARPMIMRSKFNPLKSAYLRMLELQRDNAPVFQSAPTQTDVVYTATDGNLYFIPNAVVGVRLRGSTTPDVFIERHASNTQGGGGGDLAYILRVTFELRRPDTLPDSAHPLPMDHFAVSLQPGNGELIPFPVEGLTVLPAPDDADPDVVQRLVAQVEIDVDRIVNILQNDSQARFVVTGNIHYQLATEQTGDNQSPPIRRPVERIEALPGLSVNPENLNIRFKPKSLLGTLATRGLGLALNNPQVLASVASKVVSKVKSNNETDAPKPTVSPVTQKTLKLATLSQYMLRPTTPAERHPNTNSSAQAAEATISLLLTNTGNSGLGAYFPKSIAKNRSVYAGVDSSFSNNPDAVWISSNVGYFKESAIPNQFYVLPDGYFLSLNVEKSVPDMSVLMTPNPDPKATGSNAYRIRVRFGISPYLDASRLRDMRAFLTSRLGVVYPDLVLGGYAGGSFEPTHLFDQLGSTALGGAAGPQTINPAQPFEFILDCTMEFYTLLAKLLVSTDGQGLKGNVHLQLKTDSNPSAGLTDVVAPVCLRLDQVANHPLTNGLAPPVAMPMGVEPDPNDASSMNPKRVLVSNPSQLTVSVATVIPTLLLTQDDLPPINAALASPTPVSLHLPPGGNIVLDLQAPGSISAWTGVAVEFDGIAIQLDATQVLNQIHQMAKSSSFKTMLNVHCYALAHPESLPNTLSNLIGVHVQVQNSSAGAAVQDIYVTRDQANPTVAIAYSLADMLNGASLDQPKCQYRCRNMTALGETGEWSQWQENTGQDLFVSPVVVGG